MMSRRDLGQEAVAAAARLRGSVGLGLADAACPYEIAARQGVVVRLEPLGSVEGLYMPTPRPTIFIGSERPAGRRRFTCAHELGHHSFGHGARLDELLDASVSRSGPEAPEEILAQRFAAALLMPKVAVLACFHRRSWRPECPTSDQVFRVAQELGVGYSTLLFHMCVALKVLSRSRMEALRRVPLASIRAHLTPAAEGDVFVVDSQWGVRALEIEVLDRIVAPDGMLVAGRHVERIDPHTFRAATPGVAHVGIPGRTLAVEVRVSRHRFAGLAKHRHLEEVADDD